VLARRLRAAHADAFAFRRLHLWSVLMAKLASAVFAAPKRWHREGYRLHDAFLVTERERENCEENQGARDENHGES
jgi:hypothetical protein